MNIQFDASLFLQIVGSTEIAAAVLLCFNRSLKRLAGKFAFIRQVLLFWSDSRRRSIVDGYGRSHCNPFRPPWRSDVSCDRFSAMYYCSIFSFVDQVIFCGYRDNYPIFKLHLYFYKYTITASTKISTKTWFSLKHRTQQPNQSCLYWRGNHIVP